MSVKFKGDWLYTKNWLAVAPVKLNREISKIMENFSTLILQKIRMHIISQDLDWPALASSTVMRKGFETIYIDKGSFYKNMVIERKKAGKSTQWQIRPSKRYAKGSGKTYQDLALFLEYGTIKMPARPLWRPMFDEVKKIFPYEDIKRAIRF